MGARAQGKALPVQHIYREVREHVNIKHLCVSRSFGSQQVLWAQQTMKDGGEEGEEKREDVEEDVEDEGRGGR